MVRAGDNHALPSKRAVLSRWLAWVMGIACVGIGVVHFALGIYSVPGEGSAGATVDSRERFYGAVFAGYGLAWIWAARQAPTPANAIRWLAAIFLAGGLGRLVSIGLMGPPNGFQLVLAGIELVLPPVFWWLASRDDATSRGQS
jgi:hypothetical protein